MTTEKEFTDKYKDYSKEQLLQLAYINLVKAEQIEENYKALARRFFGPRSEKINPDQLSLFNEAELTAEAEPEKAEESETVPHARRKGKRNERLKSLQVKEEHVWPGNRNCPVCGRPMQEVAPDVVEYLEYIPEQYILHRYIVHNLTCRGCNEENMGMAVYNNRSSLPPRLIEGSFVTPPVVVNAASNKFLLGEPFYRQEKDLLRRGIPISRQNMCGWVIKTADLYLHALYDRMMEDGKSCEVIHMDETTLTCLEEKRNGRASGSYAWLMMSGEYEEKQMAVYFYNATREYSTVGKLLGPDFRGVIQSDGYGAYSEYAGTEKKAGCWAHARRRYNDALAGSEKVYKAYQKADRKKKEEILEQYPSLKDILRMTEYMQRMFKMEKSYKEAGMTPEDILEQRKENYPRILEDIHSLAVEMKDRYLPQSKAGKATAYLLNQWEPLNYFMTDGRVPMTNNTAEREGIKPLVMSRKNFLFADTVRGAEASMVWFSLLVSAVMNHLNPQKYMIYILDQMSSQYITDELISRLLPYSKDLPQEIKITSPSR